MNALPLIGFALLTGALVFVYRGFARSKTEPVAIFCYLFALFFVWRPFLIAFGLDLPYPTYLFSDVYQGVVFQTCLVLSVFLGFFAIGFAVFRSVVRPARRLMPFIDRAPRPEALAAQVFWCTAAGVVLTALLGLIGDSPSEFLRAAKVDKEFAGLYFVRVFPSIGAMLSAALLIELASTRRRGGVAHRRMTVFALVFLALNAGTVFLWGSRGVAVVALFVVAVGTSRSRQIAAVAFDVDDRITSPSSASS